MLAFNQFLAYIKVWLLPVIFIYRCKEMSPFLLYTFLCIIFTLSDTDVNWEVVEC